MLTTLLVAAVLATEPGTASAEPAKPSVGKQLPPEEPTSIRVGIGMQTLIKVRDLKRLAVGNPEVFDVRALGGGELLIVGRGEGTSNLLIFDSRGRHRSIDVTVGSGDMDALEDSALKLLLRDSPEATLRYAGGRILVEGLIRNPSELRMLADHPHVVVLAKLDPRVVERRVLEINAELVRLGITGARAVLVGRRKLVLEGTVGSEEERRKAQLVADALFADVQPYL